MYINQTNNKKQSARFIGNVTANEVNMHSQSFKKLCDIVCRQLHSYEKKDRRGTAVAQTKRNEKINGK
jgi:hypothetical protein